MGAKTVLPDDGPLPIEVPRDREGTFEPQFIPKHLRRFTGFDDKILALYARGMTVRKIQAFLAEMYAVEVSPDLISTVTDGIVAEVTAWQSRPLEPMYPVVFFDALRVKIRDEATVRSEAVYLALAVLPDGTRDILGLWIEQTEGAKFWMKVFSDLKTRGCQDILIAVTDGLKGIEEALAAVYPATTLQTCIVHLDSEQSGFRQVEGAQAVGDGAAADLHGANGRGRERRLGRLCAGALGQEVSDDRGSVAPCLGAGHSVLCVPAGSPAADLHDQRSGKRARATPKNHQDARPLSKRRRRDEIDLARAPQHHREVAAYAAHLARRHESFAILYDVAFFDPRRKMHSRMDAAGAVDAENASTAPWKTAQDAVSHSAHTHHPFKSTEDRDRRPSTRSTHEFLTLPLSRAQRTPNLELQTEREPEPRSENPEV